jgi:hypothetical protein
MGDCLRKAKNIQNLKKIPTTNRLERIQCAAVKTNFSLINEPPQAIFHSRSAFHQISIKSRTQTKSLEVSTLTCHMWKFSWHCVDSTDDLKSSFDLSFES